MDRLMLSDRQWQRIAPLLPGKKGDAGRSGEDNRLFVEAVLWIVRVGAPWRDLPEDFGKWSSVWKRFRRWALKGVSERVFEALSQDPDFEYAIVDGTIVKVHRHATGAKGGTQNQAIGKSRGGLTTKIVALVDGLGNLARFVLLPGQRHDSIGVKPLITGIDFEALIADKAFDSNALRALLNERGALAVIPAKADRKTPIPHDREMYKWRHLVENFFQRIKEFRRIATRYDKTDTSFAAAIYLAAALLAIR
ncbi:MAG: IS5 family transposase [Rhizobiales bacterium]|nr:IS5 family transposase [Hyphomicrobiales bacterium]